jgi:hypothetical protein
MMIIPDTDIQQEDTTSVCGRNSIADISFYDQGNVIIRNEVGLFNRFPFLFTEKNRQIQIREKAFLIKQLKQGQDLPFQPFHNDWMIGILIISAFLYSLVRAASANLLSDIFRFFKFRGRTDTVSRNTSGFFNWQSTILNLISFLVFGLFIYCAAAYYNIVPAGFRGILFWLICLAIVITAATLRHIVCFITGKISGEDEVFREYLVGVYQSYRFSAMILFVLIVLLLYTLFFPSAISFILGASVLIIMYLISVIRLMIIFLNRNISIFYLILYLCALEILPVVISVKYFTGLV